MSKEKSIPNPVKQKIDFALATDAQLAALLFQESQEYNILGRRSSLQNAFRDTYIISTMAITSIKAPLKTLDVSYFAKDENSQLVGMKHVSLQLEETSHIFVASGGIATKESGKQIALGIEILNMTLLQNFADYTEIPIQLSMPDYNLQRIENIRQSLRSEPKNEELLENLKHTQAQRISWEKIYGNNGALGLADGKKLILPNPSKKDAYLGDEDFLQTDYHIAISKQRRNTISWLVEENMSKATPKDADSKEQLIKELSLTRQILKDNNII